MQVIKKVRLCDVITSSRKVTSLDQIVLEGLSEEVTVTET